MLRLESRTVVDYMNTHYDVTYRGVEFTVALTSLDAVDALAHAALVDQPALAVVVLRVVEDARTLADARRAVPNTSRKTRYTAINNVR